MSSVFAYIFFLKHLKQRRQQSNFKSLKELKRLTAIQRNIDNENHHYLIFLYHLIEFFFPI